MQQRHNQRPSDAGLSFDDVASGSYAPQSDYFQDRPPSAPPFYRDRSISQTVDPNPHVPKAGERVFYPTAFESAPGVPIYNQHDRTQSHVTQPTRQNTLPFQYTAPQVTRPPHIYPTLRPNEGINRQDYYNPPRLRESQRPPSPKQPVRIQSPVGFTTRRGITQERPNRSPSPRPVVRDQIPWEHHREFAPNGRNGQPPIRPQSPGGPGSPKQTVIKPTPSETNRSHWTQPTMTPALHPGVYDGHSDPTIWLREYELICEANSWDTDDIRLRKIIGYLIEAPRIYLMEEKEKNPNMTYKQFKKGLKTQFTSTCHSLMVIGKIQRRIQRPSETFEDYWYDKLQLVNTLAPEMDEHMKMTFLMEGLHRSLHIKVLEHVIINPPETRNKLFTLIKSLNDVKLFIQDSPAKTQSEPSLKKVQFNDIPNIDQKERYQRDYRPGPFQYQQFRYRQPPAEKSRFQPQFQNRYQRFDNPPQSRFQNQQPRYPQTGYQNRSPRYSYSQNQPRTNYQNFNQWANPTNQRKQWNNFFDWGNQRFANPNQWNRNQSRMTSQQRDTEHAELKGMIGQLIQQSKAEIPPQQTGRKWNQSLTDQTEVKQKWNQSPPKQKTDTSQRGKSPRRPGEVGACFICNQMGHIAKNCPTNTAGSSEFKENKPRKIGPCYKCQQMGHYANSCPLNTPGASNYPQPGNFNRRTQ